VYKLLKQHLPNTYGCAFIIGGQYNAIMYLMLRELIPTIKGAKSVHVFFIKNSFNYFFSKQILLERSTL